MPPTVKEKAAATTTPESAARPASSLPGDSSTKQQPVPLEIPVAVNGARGVDGSDKREPFSENTKTVLVFGSGAVIRLSSPVAPGQLLFLTNEKTKKEVVCQVVKSKNYRNVSGYVELEFTEPAIGFWGMRFPGDRLVSVPPAAPVAPAVSSPAAGSATVTPPPPTVSKADAPAAHVVPAPAAKPAAPTVLSRDTEAKPSATKSVVPAGPKVEAPVPVVQKPIVAPPPVAPPAMASSKPEVSASADPQAPIEPAFPIVDPSRGAEAKAFIIASQPETAPILSAFDEDSLTKAPDGLPVTPTVVSPSHEAASKDPEMEDLKRHTARLQEQLSSLHFADADSISAARAEEQTYVAPVIARKDPPETAAKALGVSKVDQRAPIKARSADAVKVASPSEKSSLVEEELKIPSWLEPLARNVAAAAPTEEPIEREKTQRPLEHAKAEEITPELLAFEPQENAAELRTPNFGSSLALDENASITSADSARSGKGFLVGAIAAGVLLAAAGGAWYWRQQSMDAHAGAPSAQMSTVSFPSAGSQAPSRANATIEGTTAKPSRATGPSQQAKPLAQNSSPLTSSTIAQSNPQTHPASVMPASASTASTRTLQPSSSPAKGGSATASAEPEPAPEQPKKPALGTVRLATPKVTQRRNTQNSLDPDPGLGLNDAQPDANADTLNTGLALDNKQPAAPAAPLPIGGDVKQAKLLSGVPPVYPTLAKSQRVSGDVRIDALIDANGHVSTMKVVSGPTLLHQAAMDALRQWKYQPAALDGKPVPMHLTVTIQFRLQ